MRRLFTEAFYISKITRVILDYEPLYLIYAVPRIIINASLPLLYVYFPKLIIQALTEESDFTKIIEVIAIYSSLLFAANLFNIFLEHRCSISAEKFAGQLRGEIGKLSMELELKDVESADIRDIIQLADNATNLTGTLTLVQNIISNIVTISGLAYIILRLDWVFVLLVTASLTAKIGFGQLQYSYRKERRLSYAKNDRLGSYLTELTYFNGGSAKEIRLNNLQNWFLNKIKGYRNEMVTMQLDDFHRYSLFEVITAAIKALQSLIILWILSIRFSNGSISIADFTMYFSAVTALSANLSGVAEHLSDYRQQILDATDYQKLLGIKHSSNHSDISTDTMSRMELIFKNVSFTYPNTDTPILHNINIKIRDREKLAIVGLNGAGKTTFIKLLCKFYRPTAGRILLNGTDIWNIPNEEYYNIIATVFQDYINLSASLKENIAMSEEADAEKVQNAIEEAGLSEYIGALPNALDTSVSKQFDDDGIELSGGQGQKLAIARALYKNTPVLILDEPTASLDAKAEGEIYNSFFRAASNKTTIFISHRLAASTLADNIAVFSHGEITEYGHHTALLKRNGIYAEMFNKQSRPYVDEDLI